MLACPSINSEEKSKRWSQTPAETHETGDGKQEMSEGICQNLQELRLRDNLISELGMRELAGALMVDLELNLTT